MIRKYLGVISLGFAISQVLLPSRAGAMKMEFTPVIANVTPTNSQVASSEGSLVIRQDAATGFGARVGLWIIPRLGVELNMLTASSSIQLVGGTVIGLDATMLQLDLRGRVRLNDPKASVGFDAIAGVGISDLGDPLSDLGEDLGLKTPSTFTIVIGIGATIPVSDKIVLRFDVEDHIHDSNFEIDDTTLGYSIDNRKQNDIVVAAGIVIPIF